jgi:hypothetical protein
MLQDSLGVVVTEEDDLNTVDLGNMILIQNQIVEVIACNNRWLDQSLGQDPILGLLSNWMAWRDHETTVQLAHSRSALPCFGFDYTDDSL